MVHHRAQEVLDFWFGPGVERGKRHKRWFAKDPAFDAEIAARFRDLHESLGGSSEWLDPAPACLARILVLDQFPRHIFRGQARAFAADPLAREAARHALSAGYDRAMVPVERLFVYLPFQHSEVLADQVLGVELCEPLRQFPETEDAYRFALAHRDIVARFGRFPHRNAALGRETTTEEAAFLKTPGSSF